MLIKVIFNGNSLEFHSFVILGFVALLTYFTNPFYTIIAIILASFGGAFVEPLKDAYFFKEIRSKEKQNRLFPIFKSSADVGSLLAPALFSTILLYLDFKGLFVFAGVLMLLFALVCLKLKR